MTKADFPSESSTKYVTNYENVYLFFIGVTNILWMIVTRMYFLTWG